MQAHTSSWPTEAELNWTPRQLEVIQLIAKGNTNAQIAEHLDISLAGAKWHVSEILSKLGVESREAIPDYWRSRRGPVRAMRRRFALALPALPIGPMFAAGTIGGVAVVAGSLLAVAWPSAQPDPKGQLVQRQATDPVEVARTALADLASVSRFAATSTSFDPGDTSGFVLKYVEDVSFEGEPSQRVVLEHPGITIDLLTHPLTFEAVVSANSGELLSRGFTPVTIPLPDTAFPLVLGPHYEVARTTRANGVVDVLSIGKNSNGDWTFVVGPADGQRGAYAILGTSGLEPGRIISTGGGRVWLLGSAHASVALVRATLQDGTNVEAIPVSPPTAVGFPGSIFFAASGNQYATSLQAFDTNGSELDHTTLPKWPPEPDVSLAPSTNRIP